MRVEIVDVFAEAPLEGNQLAVVRDAAKLSSEQMQDIAREMNFSETTFVLEENADRARVRIFTPGQELPFAGHPTLGTAWVLGRSQGSYTLDLEVGPVTVTFDSNDGESGVCWMAPPMPETLATISPEKAAALLNLSVDDLHADYQPTSLQVGPQFAFIGVRDDAVLARTSLNAEVREALLAEGAAVSSVFAFCESELTDYAGRMFFDAGGLREDPATGSANSAFAIYLRDLCGKAPGHYVVAQGDYIQRPSRIYLDIGEDTYRVGGKVQKVLTGELADVHI